MHHGVELILSAHQVTCCRDRQSNTAAAEVSARVHACTLLLAECSSLNACAGESDASLCHVLAMAERGALSVALGQVLHALERLPYYDKREKTVQ